MKTPFLLVIFSTLVVLVHPEDDVYSCDSKIYCQGELLETIQSAKLFHDSKTFVDMAMKYDEEHILMEFKTKIKDQNYTTEDLKQFVNDNFANETEFVEWEPSDFKESPKFLERIEDKTYRRYAKTVVGIWKKLGRKINQTIVEKNGDRFSLIPVPNPFIVPGGRFREIYYWDSYWIIKGLLLSEMYTTAKGMLENFFYLTKKFGHVPNGNRVYYSDRSQPPLLTLMMQTYVEAMNDTRFLKDNIKSLDTELEFWYQKRSRNETTSNFPFSHYDSESNTPRPESYEEDVEACSLYSDLRRKDCYRDIKSGAESGIDFSSKWFENIKQDNLSGIVTRRIYPVELQSYLYKCCKALSDLYAKLGVNADSTKWSDRAKKYKSALEIYYYHKEEGIWFDLIDVYKKRNEFYVTNFVPLWAEAYDISKKEEIGKKASQYFKKTGLFDYTGGIPTSKIDTGEQWDFPNAWPPLQEMVILGLNKTGQKDAIAIAKLFAKRWIDSLVISYDRTKAIFEKFDATKPGSYGKGGEYHTQAGFGWTNGIALSLINDFFTSSKKQQTKDYYSIKTTTEKTKKTQHGGAPQIHSVPVLACVIWVTVLYNRLL